MTSNTDLPARPDNLAVIFIAASPDRIWNALTDPLDQATYFGGKTEIGQQGERWIRHATEKWPTLTGIVLIREPPHRLLLTWSAENDPPADRVEFLIEPTANGTTRVTINEYHVRDWGADYNQAAAQGWAALLSGLKTLVETGRPLPPPF
ncbi:MAG: SRPBCC domain-containing protein [Hyphomonadaceae bacterium]